MLYTQSFGSQAALFLFKQIHCQHYILYKSLLSSNTTECFTKNITMFAGGCGSLWGEKHCFKCQATCTAVERRKGRILASKENHCRVDLSTCSGIWLGCSNWCCHFSLCKQCITLQIHTVLYVLYGIDAGVCTATLLCWRYVISV